MSAAELKAVLLRWRCVARSLHFRTSLPTFAALAGDRAAVDAQRERNRRIGEATGCWKGGVLVEDDAGSVAKWLAEHPDE